MNDDDRFTKLNKKLQDHAPAYRNGVSKSAYGDGERHSAGGSITAQNKREARSFSSRAQFDSAHDREPNRALKPTPPKPPAPPAKPKPPGPLKPLAALKPMKPV